MTAECAPSRAGRDTAVLVRTIVVVEDRLVSNLVGAVLRKHGYLVRGAELSEALTLLREDPGGVGVLVTNAPAAFLEFGDRVPLLYLTSQPDVKLRASFSACRVVLKPFVPSELAEAVAELMGSQNH